MERATSAHNGTGAIMQSKSMAFIHCAALPRTPIRHTTVCVCELLRAVQILYQGAWLRCC